MRYIDTAILRNIFDENEIKEKFGSIVRLMHILALHDNLNEGATTMKFMLSLTDRIQTLLSQKTYDYPIHRNLVNIIWTMIYRDEVVETSSKSSNPLIPRLLEKLYNYKRDSSLTRVEYLELY